jgi:hypothetical protein
MIKAAKIKVTMAIYQHKKTLDCYGIKRSVYQLPSDDLV